MTAPRLKAPVEASPTTPLSEVLDEVRDVLERHVVLPSIEAIVALVLWIATTHAQAAIHTAPRLLAKSPQKRCGKSRLFDLLEALCHRPLITVNATVAAVFRSIDGKNPPTLLMDEADTIWNNARRGSDNSEDLRALVNAGFGRGRPVLRCVGPSQTPTEFSTFCMVALAGIGDFAPDTVLDRAIVVRMRRRAPGEQVHQFRQRDAAALAPLREQLNKLLQANLEQLADAEPNLPVQDRAADTWEPLVAVADLAGAHWPLAARQAVIALTREKDDSEAEESLSVRLLLDIRQVFQDRKAAVLSSENLVRALTGLPESPWATFDLNPRGLAYRLKDFGIRPDRIREDASQARGYRQESFADAFRRYLPDEPADDFSDADAGASSAVTASQPQVKP